MLMPMRSWRRGLAAGILLAGADAAWGQYQQTPPLPDRPAAPQPAPQAICSPVPAVVGAPPRAATRMRDWFGRFERPEAVPFGLSVDAHFAGHVAAGTAAQMAFYDFDFLPGSDRLNYRGVDQVYRVARLMGVSPAPVVVERTPRDPGLAERRRLAVLAALGAVEPSASPSRVVVADPVAYPLRGSEALLIYNTMTRQTQMYGALPVNVQSGGFNTIGSGTSTPGTSTPGTSNPSPNGR